MNWNSIKNGRKLLLIGTMVSALLVGCGGGGGGGGGEVSTTSATITPYKGAYSSGSTVVIKDANGNPVTLISGGAINADGIAVVVFNASVAYPLIVEVTGTYYNETTGTTEVTTTPLRGFILSASAAQNGAVPVTIITETAVADLVNRIGAFSPGNPATAVSAAVSLNIIGAMLGIPASTVPVFDPATNLTSDADTLRLAALSVVANSQTGATLVDKVKALADLLVKLGGNPATSVISQTAYDNALASVTSGPLSLLEAGAPVPASVTINTANYDALNATYTTTGVALVWDQANAKWDQVDWQ